MAINKSDWKVSEGIDIIESIHLRRK